MVKRDPKTLVTKKMLDQAVDAILKGVERMFDKQNKRIDRRFKRVDQRFDRLETDVRDIRRRVIDLEVDIPTRKAFDDLKTRVDKFHPL